MVLCERIEFISTAIIHRAGINDLDITSPFFKQKSKKYTF